MVVAFLVPWLLHQATNLVGITGDPFVYTSIDMLFILANIVIGIWFVIDLGILRGTRGTNRYGPDPLVAGTPPGDVT
jgi:uncharacterized membrane protein YhaH (DUF805 family)